MSPWIEASRPLVGNRWLDESGVALRAQPLTGRASVSADLHKMQGLGVAPMNGQTSVSASLAVRHVITGAVISGGASVSANLGYFYRIEAASSGQASVSGELIVGQLELIAGASAGKSTVVSANLDVRRYTYIAGSQDTDGWGADESLPPTGSGRDEGPTRRRFTPRSSGRVNEDAFT